jgi:hypothetical protein
MYVGKLALMPDTECTTPPDGLEYTEDGVLKSPQLGDGPWGSLSFAIAFFSPFVVLFDRWGSPVPMGFITTKLFQTLRKQHVFSENQIDNGAFLFVCLILVIFCTFLFFFQKNVRKYSSQKPPPVPLRKLWPKQIRIMLVCGGAGLIGAPVALAASRSTFIVLFLLYVGTWFFADGLARGALYAYFYFKYWRSSD